MALHLSTWDTVTNARAGFLELPHGQVATPAFMPVGTNGTVKAIRHEQVAGMGYRLILANTYHLYLRPGLDVIREAGGLHRFSTWEHNILTDSGGYQVFSLAPFRRIMTDGVRFRSHIDGSYHELTPERVVDAQCVFGSDVLMPLDVCTGPGIDRREAEEALRTTTRWAKRSARRWRDAVDRGFSGHLFGIVQGNFFEDLRRQSAEELAEVELPGYAIGGLSVGESTDVFLRILQATAAVLPEEKPRYLMGIGTPDYILAAVRNGIDMFDCVFPTRIARNGMVFTRDGTLALKKRTHEREAGPIDEACSCVTCRRYSRGYLRHLFKAREMLGPMLATEHNLHFLASLMREIRRSIEDGVYSQFQADFLHRYEAGGE
jgi:queuine tRNA-ribosyltransferase